MQITILRHGMPDLPVWDKIYSAEIPEWIAAYNTADVRNEVPPPCQKMIDELNHQFIICSTLNRSIHSANIIADSPVDLIDDLFSEAELPHIRIPFLRLTPHVWSMIFRVFWFIGISPKAEAVDSFKLRVSLAAEKLIQLAIKHESVLFVGHGIINRFLAKELIAQGWLGDDAPNGNKYYGYQYWEYANYTKN